jgi:hypothetical protein
MLSSLITKSLASNASNRMVSRKNKRSNINFCDYHHSRALAPRVVQIVIYISAYQIQILHCLKLETMDWKSA